MLNLKWIYIDVLLIAIDSMEKHTVLGTTINSEAWLCQFPVKIIHLRKPNMRCCIERWTTP